MFDEWCHIPIRLLIILIKWYILVWVFSGDTDELFNKQWTKKVSLKQTFEIYVLL